MIYSRAASAFKKVSRVNAAQAKEVRWSLALHVHAKRVASAPFALWPCPAEVDVGDESWIVKTFAMSGLVDVAEQRAELRGDAGAGQGERWGFFWGGR